METSSPTGTFILTQWHRDWLKRRAFQAAPEEACGFILSDGRFVEIPNVHPQSYKNFAMDRKSLDKIDPKDVAALWHTHPGGSLRPSAEDQKNMAVLGESYGRWIYLIATKNDVAEYDTKPQSIFWEGFVSS